MPLLHNRFSGRNEPEPGERSQPLTLYQLNRQICEALEDAFPESYWVVAELAEVNRYTSGHCYLTLIEKGPGNREQAKARATIWRDRYTRISQEFESQTGHPLRPGLKVLLNASVRFHELHGLSLDILQIDPNYTIGDLARQRQETINRLREEGLFDRNKELALPLVPQRLALISSPTAAGLQDFLHQLGQNAFGYKFLTTLFPATVQGKEAVASVTDALDRISQNFQQFDAVVLIRGGGSQTDLYCFDQYDLAAAVASAPLPLLTGIGHERDETITDLVAHTRLKTPTAVAAFLIERAKAFEDGLDEVQWRIRESANTRLTREQTTLARHRRELTHLTNRLLRQRSLNLQELTQAIRLRQQVFVQDARHAVSCHQMALTHLVTRLLADKKAALRDTETGTAQACQTFLLYQKGRLLHLSHCVKGGSQEILGQARLLLNNDQQQLRFLASSRVQQAAHNLELTAVKLSLHDPRAMLLRGYTLTYAHGRLVRSVEQLSEGTVLETRLAGGTVQSTVTKLEIS